MCVTKSEGAKTIRCVQKNHWIALKILHFGIRTNLRARFYLSLGATLRSFLLTLKQVDCY